LSLLFPLLLEFIPTIEQVSFVKVAQDCGSKTLEDAYVETSWQKPSFSLDEVSDGRCDSEVLVSPSYPLYQTCLLVPLPPPPRKVLENARCFEEKLNAWNLMIRYYQSSGSEVEKGFELCFDVLEKLGESFPKTIEDTYVENELTETNQQLQERLTIDSLGSFPVMENKQKLQAMVCVSHSLYL
jgi:hypothetical protein